MLLFFFLKWDIFAQIEHNESGGNQENQDNLMHYAKNLTSNTHTDMRIGLFGKIIQ